MTINISIRNKEKPDNPEAKTVRVSAQLGETCWKAAFLKPGQSHDFTLYEGMNLTVDEVDTINGLRDEVKR